MQTGLDFTKHSTANPANYAIVWYEGAVGVTRSPLFERQFYLNGSEMIAANASVVYRPFFPEGENKTVQEIASAHYAHWVEHQPNGYQNPLLIDLYPDGVAASWRFSLDHVREYLDYFYDSAKRKPNPTIMPLVRVLKAEWNRYYQEHQAEALRLLDRCHLAICNPGTTIPTVEYIQISCWEYDWGLFAIDSTGKFEGIVETTEPDEEDPIDDEPSTEDEGEWKTILTLGKRFRLQFYFEEE